MVKITLSTGESFVVSVEEGLRIAADAERIGVAISVEAAE